MNQTIETDCPPERLIGRQLNADVPIKSVKR
jgi:hypothetical protein